MRIAPLCYTHDRSKLLRQQAFAGRLVEEADFRAAQELFGGQDLDKMQLTSAKDFQDFAGALAQKYVLAHSKSPHYKALVKALFKVSRTPEYLSFKRSQAS